MASETFKQAYGVLQQHAQTLRDQRDPNIDDLLTIVTESVQAYKVCQERIEAVEKALEKALSDTQAPPPSHPPVVNTAAPAVLANDSDDIPF
jgi:exodeoxyribonuclease VII small subunit